MLMGKQIRLLPTPEQEILFRKSAGVARWAYNFFLSEVRRVYKEYMDNGQTGNKSISGGEVRKYINNELKPTTHKWLSEVSCNVMKHAVMDAEDAWRRYFKGLAEKPKKKKKHKSDMKFYVNYESLRRMNGGFHGERLGFVRTAESLPKLPKGTKYSNPRIHFDGKYWYLSVSYEVPEIACEHTDESLGIDLGVKDLAICSNKKVYKNINKTKRVKSIEKKKKREKRKLSRKIEANIIGYYTNEEGHRCPIYKRDFNECKNFQKQKRKVRLIERQLANIRLNYTHQTTTEIVKTKPSRVVMEDLNVKGMMKNKHLSKAIQEQTLGEFIRQMKYKCQRYGIEFVQVSRWFPSSKMCSCCGHIKRDLKLKDRVYHCEECGLVIDRDYNASLNLAHYTEST
jgi:putative transposase